MAPNWRGAGRDGGIPKHRHSRHARRDLLEQLQPFPADAVFENAETGGVAARPRQAVDEAGADRIGDDVNTIGTVRVACSNGPNVGVPWVRMTSGASATNSAACLRMSVGIGRGPAVCRSARCGRRSSPIAPAPEGTPRGGSDIPDRPRLRAGARRCAASARLLRARRERPRRRRPPSSVMNSRRRIIRSPRRRGRAASAALRGRAPWRS